MIIQFSDGYPLVSVYKTMENLYFMGKSNSFLYVYQRINPIKSL